jgi:hypothetical protein
MSDRGPWVAALVIILAIAGVTSLAYGVFELSQPTSSTSTSYSSYSAAVAPTLNISVRPNGLYPARNLTDPSTVFANITTGMAFSMVFQFEASPAMVGVANLATEATFASGTSPGWSRVVESESFPIDFNGTGMTEAFGIPLNLTSVLNASAAIDSELGLAPGAPTLTLNTTMQVFLPGVVAQNNSSMVLTFVYSQSSGSGIVPTAYTAIQVGDPVLGAAAGTWATHQTTSLPSHANLAYTMLVVAAAVLVGAVVVARVFLPRSSKTALKRFLAENAQNVVRVRADSRPGGKAVQVADVGELVKLANLAGEPIFLFESPTGRGSFLYVLQGGTTFALPFPEPDQTT